MALNALVDSFLPQSEKSGNGNERVNVRPYTSKYIAAMTTRAATATEEKFCNDMTIAERNSAAAEIAHVVPHKRYISKNSVVYVFSLTVWSSFSEFDAVGSEICRILLNKA